MEIISSRLSLFFDWVITSSLQVSILIALVLAVKALVGKRLAAQWHYCLWFLVLARIFMPWAPQSRISVFNFVPDFRSESSKLQSQPAQINYDSKFETEENTFASDSLSPAEIAKATEQQAENAEQVTEAGFEKQSAQTKYQLKKISVFVWLAGAFGLAVYILSANFSLLRIVKKQRVVTKQNVLELFEECKEQIGVHTVVGIVATEKVKSPALFGFIRPRLLLPAGVIEDFSEEELRYIFLHELSHLKRRDIGFSWLAALGLVLHWFNPLVWFAFYRMRMDRELACDALTLSMMGGEETNGYGKTIIHLLERFSRGRQLVGLAGVMEDKSQLKRRITMIAKFDRKSYRLSIGALVLIAVLGCVVLTNARSANTYRLLDGRVPEELQKDLVVYYPFDEDDNGKVVNIAWEGFDGEAKGAEYTTDGFVNGGYVFDGRNDYIEIGRLKLGSFSFCAWVKRNDENSALNNRRIFLLDDGYDYYAFQGNSGDGVGVYITDDIEINDYDQQLEAGRWTHLAVTFDGETINIYVDGELTETGEETFEGVIKGIGYIGFSGSDGAGDRHGGDFCWKGMIDEVAIFDKALERKDIKQIYEMTRNIATGKATYGRKAKVNWWQDAETIFGKLAHAFNRQEWRQVQSTARELRDVFRNYMDAFLIDELKSEIGVKPRMTQTEQERLKQAESKRKQIDGFEYSENIQNRLVSCIVKIEEVSNDLDNSIENDKMYLVYAIYEELSRQWQEFLSLVDSSRYSGTRQATRTTAPTARRTRITPAGRATEQTQRYLTQLRRRRVTTSIAPARTPEQVNQPPQPGRTTLETPVSITIAPTTSGRVAATAVPEITIKKTTFDFGSVQPESKNICEFEFTNTGSDVLKIVKVVPSCGCTVITLDKEEYLPGESGKIQVLYTAGTQPGQSSKHIYVLSNDKDNPYMILTIEADINETGF